MTTLLKTVFGSKMYGLSVEGSDEDIRGVFLAPADKFLGLGTYKDVRSGPGEDEKYHEVGQFLKLCLKNALPALEVLFTPDEFVLEAAPEMEWLRENKERFLNQTFLKCYGGMVTQNLQRAFMELKRDDYTCGDGLGEKKYFKFCSHAVRIAETARSVFETGTFSPVVQGPLRTHLLEIRSGKYSRQEAYDLAINTQKELFGLEAGVSLPEQPPICEEVDKWLIELRLDRYRNTLISELS